MTWLTKEQIAEKPKETHILLYRMFCSACIINERDGYPEHASKQRKIMADLLSHGKISPEEAVEIETEIRTTLPELEAFLVSLVEGEAQPNTKH